MNVANFAQSSIAPLEASPNALAENEAVYVEADVLRQLNSKMFRRFLSINNPGYWGGWLCAIVCVLASCQNKDYKAHIDKVQGLPERVDFNFHIKPILSDRCFACHGPDKNARSTDFRLDTKEGAFAALKESKGEKAIVSGDPHNSEIFQRIISADPEYRMPPPESNLNVTEREIALIAKWIEQGAEWKSHWSFLPLEVQSPPKVKDKEWPRNTIDHFVLNRLEQEGLNPSPRADKEQLIRRVTFDLTGLPPTISEIDAFIADESLEAYERVVDRLLSSEAYGERMATEWLDVSRYADSHGYQADGLREMWQWRDWVIKSYNENMPFDQFVTWQLAGDMLPNATRDQILATAFNRNHGQNSEAGVIDEEFRLEYVFDRTNTTGTAFLGLTMECARCHDHKFDPIAQKEYFELSAFFNNVPELGLISADGNAGPLLPLPEEEVEKKLDFIEKQIKEQEQQLEHRSKEVLSNASYDKPFLSIDSRNRISDGLVAHYPLDKIQNNTTPDLVRPEYGARISGKPELEKGAIGQAFKFDNEYDFISLPKAGFFEKNQPFSIGVWVKPAKKDDYAEILGNAGTKNPYWRGHEVFLDSINRISVRLTHALPHNYIQVTTKDPIPLHEWSHFMFTYDGSSKAAGLKLFVNGKVSPVTIQFDNLYKSILPVKKSFEVEERPIRVARSYRAFTGDNGIFEGSIDDIRIYDRNLAAGEVARVFGEDPMAEAIALPKAKRTKEQEAMILEYYLNRFDRKYQDYLTTLFDLRGEHLALMRDVKEVMVMKEMETPRKTYLLARGVWDARLEEVFPGTPAEVMAFPDNLPKNRLGLARWITDKENPLFSRVTVNRFWKMYFGTGLVRTVDDFGSQGALPTHPELLNWLSRTFINNGWDVKAMQKMIAMSATYQQSSLGSKELLERDPQNQLLARGPSYRFSAEMIRDNALAASGLLVRTIGGPGTRPYQPEGLWEEKGVFSHFLLTYERDKGDGLYRRSLYTFWRRTSPPPSMMIFDAGSRYLCTVERQTTNSPQQALVLMNDPQYVEASRMLAERMIREGGSKPGDRITYGFRLLTSRRPNEKELEMLTRLYNEELAHYKKDGKAALALLGVGEYKRNAALPLPELAANTVVANMVMNLDAAYTKR